MRKRFQSARVSIVARGSRGSVNTVNRGESRYAFRVASVTRPYIQFGARKR